MFGFGGFLSVWATPSSHPVVMNDQNFVLKPMVTTGDPPWLKIPLFVKKTSRLGQKDNIFQNATGVRKDGLANLGRMERCRSGTSRKNAYISWMPLPWPSISPDFKCCSLHLIILGNFSDFLRVNLEGQTVIILWLFHVTNKYPLSGYHFDQRPHRPRLRPNFAKQVAQHSFGRLPIYINVDKTAHYPYGNGLCHL